MRDWVKYLIVGYVACYIYDNYFNRKEIENDKQQKSNKWNRLFIM
jgi:hypothetical protein